MFNKKSEEIFKVNRSSSNSYFRLRKKISVMFAACYLPIFPFFFFLGVILFYDTKRSPTYQADNAPQKLQRFFFNLKYP